MADVAPARSNLLTLAEVAELCAVSDETIRKWINAGALPYVEVGPTFIKRVYRRDAERMIQPAKIANPDTPRQSL